MTSPIRPPPKVGLITCNKMATIRFVPCQRSDGSSPPIVAATLPVREFTSTTSVGIRIEWRVHGRNASRMSGAGDVGERHRPSLSSMYIIYWANQWRIHDNKEACGKQSGDLKVKVPLNHIRHINVDNGSWTEWNGSHYVRSTARLICLGYNDSVELDNQRNDPKIESVISPFLDALVFAECRRLRLINVNASNNVRYVGDYVKANITCHNKYVYSKSETYIVFWAGHWRVHDDRSPCETKSGDVRVRPAIRKLPYINPDDSSWTEWNGTEYIPSSARLICIEYVDATKFLMKEDIKDNGPAIWIFCVAAAAGVIIIIIISVIVVIILRKRRKHSDHRVAAPISYNNKVLTQDQDYDPDGLIIIDNAIYSEYYSSVYQELNKSSFQNTNAINGISSGYDRDRTRLGRIRKDSAIVRDTVCRRSV
ncbi:hypothetical protein LSH36_173g05052 [Paralvinella palmiformis]|uniref:Uncharacterized protein n=1 Tax=Paralvinella palmiformis TaxID=53620 RepID=A0AAD9JSB4_9ANNE|nr:hypothetical protein LSH36_173g05052 [Paralvinella palmiformis]